MKFFFIFSLPLLFVFPETVYSQEKKDPSATAATSTAAPASSEEKSTAEYFVLCKNLKIVRSLRVEASPQKCTAIYTKLGQDRSIGTSQRGVENCRSFVNQVKDTLIKAGWKCKEMKSGQVSHINE